MEHPQTALLTKVLQSNKYLGEEVNKDKNNNHKEIIRRCMDLQQSVNMLFDNRTMSGEIYVLVGFVLIYELVNYGAESSCHGLLC